MIAVLFEDDNLIAINKPEGMAAVPLRRPYGQSLFEVLSAQRNERLYIVHRIDRNTSGLILFARNEQAHRWLNRQFETRSVAKTYLTVLHGVIDEDRGAIDTPLRRFGSGRVAVDCDRGKSSLTEFRVLSRSPSFTLVEARPQTGRQHQIRVHFYSIAHPVAGDPLYGQGLGWSEHHDCHPERSEGPGYRMGGNSPSQPRWFAPLTMTIPRLMLHAWRLTLPLPDGRSLSLEAPVPESFKSAAKGCGLDARCTETGRI
jgi:tRNA pseudouridine32 synthase / 23S rRNA pseudouridine746 synthase